MAFSDYQEAVEAKAYNDRWIPPVMPRSARDIRVEYDLDTGQAWVRFSFGADFDESILAAWKRSPGLEEFKPTWLQRLRLDWWPTELRGGTTGRFSVYRGEKRWKTVGGEAYCHTMNLAVDWSSRDAFSVQGAHLRCRR